MRTSSLLFVIFAASVVGLPQHDHGHSEGPVPTSTIIAAPTLPPTPTTGTGNSTPAKPTTATKPRFSNKWPIKKPTKSASASTTPLPSGFSKADPIGKFPQTPGGRIVRQRLGPWTLKGHSKLPNAILPNVTHPCKAGETCFAVAYQANLVYEDGTEANADTGCWLHHGE